MKGFNTSDKRFNLMKENMTIVEVTALLKETKKQLKNVGNRIKYHGIRGTMATDDHHEYKRLFDLIGELQVMKNTLESPYFNPPSFM